MSQKKVKQHKSPQASMKSKIRKLSIKQTALFVLVFVVLALPPVFVSHPIAYIPLLSFVVLALLSALYLFVAKRKFFMNVHFDEYVCQRGDCVAMPLRLENKGKLLLFRVEAYFFISNPYGIFEQDVSASNVIASNQQLDVDTSIRLGHVGTYKAGLNGVTIFDPLGLFHIFIPSKAQSTIVTTPRLFNITSMDLNRAAMHQSQKLVHTLISDDIDYAGVRDYEIGDPLKSIHWKLSARNTGLLTRYFETNVNYQTSIVMDFCSTNYGYEQLMECRDIVVESALALGKLAAKNDFEVKLCYINKQGERKSDPLPAFEDLSSLTKDLPLISAKGSSVSADCFFSDELDVLHGSDNIILCTPNLDLEKTELLLAAHARHIHVFLVLAVPRVFLREFQEENRVALSRLASAQLPYFIISDIADFGEGESNVK